MTLARTRSPILPFQLEVVRRQQLSPTFVRLTLGGGALRTFHAGGPLGLRDTRIKLVVGASGSGDVPVPDTSGDTWYSRWRAQDVEVRGVLRTYTARRLHADGRGPLLDVDFVIHRDEYGRLGPACAFAASATTGDAITVLGPNTAVGGYGGAEWQPPPVETAGRVLLVADETALPAVASVLSTLPAGYQGDAIVEVPDSRDFLDLPTRSQVRTCWLARGDRRRGALVLATLAELLAGPTAPGGPELLDPDALLWDVPVAPAAAGRYAWVAGEASVVRDVRRALLGAGFDRAQVAFMGYWREGRAEGS